MHESVKSNIFDVLVLLSAFATLFSMREKAWFVCENSADYDLRYWMPSSSYLQIHFRRRFWRSSERDWCFTAFTCSECLPASLDLCFMGTKLSSHSFHQSQLFSFFERKYTVAFSCYYLLLMKKNLDNGSDRLVAAGGQCFREMHCSTITIGDPDLCSKCR